jgi:hypothetical protein
MKTTKDYYVGQRVKMYDAEDDCNVYGHVVEVTDKSIKVKWNDLYDPCEHFHDEFDKIKNGVPTA